MSAPYMPGGESPGPTSPAGLTSAPEAAGLMKIPAPGHLGWHPDSAAHHTVPQFPHLQNGGRSCGYCGPPQGVHGVENRERAGLTLTRTAY